MKSNSYSCIKSPDQWLDEVLASNSTIEAQEVHFDALDDSISKVEPGLALVRSSCELLSRIQGQFKADKLQNDSWTLLVSSLLDWDKKSFPFWRDTFWRAFGQAMEPPSFIVSRTGLQLGSVPEHYSRQLQLPFEGFPEIDVLYDVSRTQEDIDEGEFYPRIYLMHKRPLGQPATIEKSALLSRDS